MKLLKAKIKGFRGISKELEVNFDAPVVILYGENGKGKSSVLNAIEWCIYGEDSISLTGTNIRERVGWEVKNRFSNECEVEITIRNNLGEYKIKRKLAGQSKSNLYLILPDNSEKLDEEAEGELNKLLSNFSFKDFLNSVYQHQEAIRFILTAKPQYRDDAIDRLLGLNDYKNIKSKIEDFQKKNKVDELQNRIEDLRSKLKIRISALEEQIENKKNELIKEGVGENEIEKREIPKIIKQIKESTEGFAQKIGIAISEEFKKVSETDIKKFIEISEREIEKLRRADPDLKKQENIYREITEIQKKEAEFKANKKTYEENERNKNAFIEKNGTIDKLENLKKLINDKIEKIEKEKEAKSLLGKIIGDVIKYLEKAEEKNICPVCGNRKDDLISILKKEWQEKYILKLKDLDSELLNQENELKKIENLILEFGRINNLWESSKRAFEEYKKSAREFLKISERDDPLSYFEIKLSELQKNYNELNEKISKRIEEIRKIEKEIEKLKKFSEIIEYENEIEQITKIEETKDWNDLEGFAERWKKFISYLNEIKNAIAKTVNDEAKKILSNINERVGEYFGRITRHPLIEGLRVEIIGEHYNFVDKNGKEVTPILSQGHYNSLALSIFIAMAESSSENRPFKFIIFDDPSQSLGKLEKEKLTEILNETANEKDLIISTMDTEFYELLKNNISKEKIIYEFKDYNKTEGPKIITL